MQKVSTQLNDEHQDAPFGAAFVRFAARPTALEPKISSETPSQAKQADRARRKLYNEGWTPRDDRPAHPELLRRAAEAAASTSSEQSVPYTRLSEP